MTIYLDTSVVLRALLGDGRPLPEWGSWERAYSSELMGVEARRALDCPRCARNVFLVLSTRRSIVGSQGSVTTQKGGN